MYANCILTGHHYSLISDRAHEHTTHPPSLSITCPGFQFLGRSFTVWQLAAAGAVACSPASGNCCSPAHAAVVDSKQQARPTAAALVVAYHQCHQAIRSLQIADSTTVRKQRGKEVIRLCIIAADSSPPSYNTAPLFLPPLTLIQPTVSNHAQHSCALPQKLRTRGGRL